MRADGPPSGRTDGGFVRRAQFVARSRLVRVEERDAEVEFAQLVHEALDQFRPSVSEELRPHPQLARAAAVSVESDLAGGLLHVAFVFIAPLRFKLVLALLPQPDLLGLFIGGIHDERKG